ncbi:hypothetical protein HYE67_002610 [Fusarium culmorum]|uniref:Uncharacterized protein n=1 Tax=Fusarium culmorum TaxID=5516 RepID=A0A7S8D1R6_FUSCU|nr:hypothetical protein HYE67_002610 [Fusarium culmorum]
MPWAVVEVLGLLASIFVTTLQHFYPRPSNLHPGTLLGLHCPPSCLVRPSQTCRIRISPCPAMRDLVLLITDPRFVPLSLTRGSRRSLPVGDPQARHMDRDDLRDLEDLAASLIRPGNGRSHKKHRAMSHGTEHCPVSAFRFGSPLQSVLLVTLACILACI